MLLYVLSWISTRHQVRPSPIALTALSDVPQERRCGEGRRRRGREGSIAGRCESKKTGLQDNKGGSRDRGVYGGKYLSVATIDTERLRQRLGRMLTVGSGSEPRLSFFLSMASPSIARMNCDCPVPLGSHSSPSRDCQVDVQRRRHNWPVRVKREGWGRRRKRHMHSSQRRRK